MLVQLDPLDEYQALLIRSLAAAGDRAAAQEQLDSCRAVLMAELGVPPGAELINAVDVPPAPDGLISVGGRASARAQLDAGQAAVSAGAVDTGLECLRRAVAEAEPLHDTPLRAQALLALESALIHSLRGRDEEGSIALHQTIAAGIQSGMRSVVAAARRELGYVELLRARYDRAETWLTEALDAAGDDLAEQAASARARRLLVGYRPVPPRNRLTGGTTRAMDRAACRRAALGSARCPPPRTPPPCPRGRRASWTR